MAVQPKNKSAQPEADDQVVYVLKSADGTEFRTADKGTAMQYHRTMGYELVEPKSEASAEEPKVESKANTPATK